MKDESQFYRTGKTKNKGRSYRCKECHRKLLRARRQTISGRITTMWNNMNGRVKRSRQYKGIEVRMTRRTFEAWARPILTVWVKENPHRRPSIDRIDPRGHYEIGNIQIISTVENAMRTRSHKPNMAAPKGKAWCSDCREYYSKLDFYKCRSTWNGLSQRCKTCAIAQTTRLRAEKKDREQQSKN